MESSATAVTEGEIFSHAIETLDQRDWDRVANVVTKLRLPERDLNRVDRLLEKNREETITESEGAELEKYLRVSSFLDLMRTRAMRGLRSKHRSP